MALLLRTSEFVSHGLTRLTLGLALPSLLVACASGTPTAESDQTDATPTTEVAETAADAAGTLEIRANGEDFVRQGFTTKDGWQIEFDHLYVTLAGITAYQSEPAFDPEVSEQPQAKAVVSVDEPKTVDLAAGDETADPILVETLEAPPGRYNAFAWKMVPAAAGPAAGSSLLLQGTASKAGETVDFTLKLNPTLAFICGDFVGDQRKGILDAGGMADLEATFHFDHLFGDGDAAPDDEINTGALGFAPLAALANNGTLEADMKTLASQLSPADYETLMGILPSLGHVGEGHCRETALTAS